MIQSTSIQQGKITINILGSQVNVIRRKPELKLGIISIALRIGGLKGAEQISGVNDKE